MSKKWLEAAARYELVREPTVEEVPPVPTLRGFMESEEGESARKLLAAANREIILGDISNAEKIKLRVVLNKDGLKKRENGKFQSIGSPEAYQLLARINGENLVFDPVWFIRQELDRIADEAP